MPCSSISYSCICFGLPYPGLFCAFPPIILASTLDCLFLVRFMPFNILYSICICFGLPFLVSSMPFQLFYFHLLGLPFLGPFCDCPPLILASALDCLFLVHFCAIPPLTLASTLNCLFPVPCFSTSYTFICFGLPFPGPFRAFPHLIQ